MRSHWSIAASRGDYVNTVVTFKFARTSENYFIKAIEHFFKVYIASSRHSGTERILQSYANLRLRLGYKSRILVSHKVLMTKRHQYFAVKITFRVHSKK